MKKNEMMDRPIVQSNIVTYMREKQRKFTGIVGEIEAYANERRIPIIPHETAVFLDFLLGQLKPEKILEIGAAIGFSGLLMAQHLSPNGHLTTIDRFDVMIERAKANFERSDMSDKITLLEGDAEHVLPTLTEQYDVIFMDSAKSKYYDFLPHCIRLLKVGGVLIVDDIFQGGTILDDIETIPRRVRKIHRRLNQFLDLVQTHPDLKSTLLPLGDGIVLIEKKSEVHIELEKE
ncbi:methyltransferase domain-containing protein [Granulicatella sp. zg-ZJ]|uniref:O-methyltransferase n=1 Tax=unclassified Granulicatella TaxID=2630493 RepID=UPI0013BF6015|nr:MULTISPECIES: O-methyltransferase [unclassified Granulicatella]NEW62215.1 methyltransferase domain-containing protein [Granulicatella sp. zg-ZJ]NEW66679.1 methyltransferase domain-containing protein [Granulicatella sp. zg-84]QMI85016.1 O-methyltransferase [Carnobacteriaceae bacterium zg-84]